MNKERRVNCDKYKYTKNVAEYMHALDLLREEYFKRAIQELKESGHDNPR